MAGVSDIVMNNNSICFVILNFNTEKESIECIKSIRKNICGEECQIVLVDNASSEGIKRIEMQYPDVHIIKNKNNLGFAKGNNIGYKFAKEDLEAEFIVVLNSDTLIEQDDFIIKIKQLYEKTKFSILGPDIVTGEGVHQNPAQNVCTSLKLVKKCLLTQKIRLIKTYIPLISRIGLNKRKNNNAYIDHQIENAALHGACLIFSPLFISKYDMAFYNETFLYGEEEFLYFNAKFNQDMLLYSPDISILHKENSATDKYIENFINKKRFVLINSIDSLKKLKMYLEEYE